jgi:alpha-beta hydrolase superfamily lysophospholipase
MQYLFLFAACFLFGAPMLAFGQSSAFTKLDFSVRLNSSDSIALREIRHSGSRTDVPALLLVHGGGASGIPCFDLDWRGNSFAEDIAEQGKCVVFVMDVRGWGKSSRPQAMNDAPDKHPPLVSIQDGAADVALAIRTIAMRMKRNDLQLFGWATGGAWSAYALAQDTTLQAMVGSLVLVNTMYGVKGAWELRNSPSPEDAYRLVDAASFVRRWNATIPSMNKADWREDEVEQAYSQIAVAADPTHSQRVPPSARVPLAYWHEHVRMSNGEKLWDARRIKVSTLLVRGALDFWSRPLDIETMQTEFMNAKELQTLILPQGTHFLFLDKPERGKAQMLEAMQIFRQ